MADAHVKSSIGADLFGPVQLGTLPARATASSWHR